MESIQNGSKQSKLGSMLVILGNSDGPVTVDVPMYVRTYVHFC